MVRAIVNYRTLCRELYQKRLKRSVTNVSLAKTAEAIAMPFVTCPRLRPRKQELDVVTLPPTGEYDCVCGGNAALRQITLTTWYR